MRFPQKQSSWLRWGLWARYTFYRLKMAGRGADAEGLLTYIAEVKARGRAWEDASEPVREARAHRDFTDSGLDLLASTGRQQLASRSLKAAQERPLIDIYPDGVSYYTRAPLGEEEARYGLLVERFKTFLPEEDPVRVALVPQVEAGLADWRKAVDALAAAESQETLSKQGVDQAVEALRGTMQALYGRLLGDMDKASAERFFSKP